MKAHRIRMPRTSDNKKIVNSDDIRYGHSASVWTVTVGDPQGAPEFNLEATIMLVEDRN